MIQSMIVTNLTTGDYATFDMCNSHFVIDTIDWDTPAVSLSTYHIPQQIGDNLMSVDIGSRKPLLTGYVIADSVDATNKAWSEYYEEQRKQINGYKQQLSKLFSPFQDIRIQVDEYYMICRPTTPVKYSYKEKENNEVLCKFSVELLSLNGTFCKDSAAIQMASVQQGFHFPTTFNSVVFGSLERQDSIKIVNNGDMETGCIISFTANGGSVINPEFYNVRTGQYIGFDIQLEDGDELIINTNKGEENAIVHDVSASKYISALGNLKTGSEFIQLTQGTTEYSYRTEQGSVNNIEANITYIERYFNIEVM